MPIDDNFTFSLSDVKTEVDDGDANDISSLSEAFSLSNSDGFDDTYDDVSGANTQSLKEFRNYDHNAQPPNYSIAVSGTTTIPIQGGTFSYTMSISPSNSSDSVNISYQPNQIGGQTETGWISIGAIPSSGSTRNFNITYSSNPGQEGDRYANITFTNSSDPNTPKDSTTLSITQTGFQ